MTTVAGTGRRQAALVSLVEAIRQLEGLTEQVGPFALPPAACDRAPELVAAVCGALDVPLRFDAPPGGRRPDHALAALVARIRQAQGDPEFAALDPSDVATLASQARRLRDEEDARYRRHILHRPDGTTVRVFDVGRPDATCIVFSPACAMDARLCLPWSWALSGSYRCLIPQTRGTTGRIEDPEAFDRRGYGVDHQAGDLIALLDQFMTSRVHLMAFCGGAVPALALAALRPDRVASLSVWHGDLELGVDAAKTEHQTNLRALLDMAGESRETAAWMRDRLASGPMSGVPDGIGPLVVRPYATAELLYRYAKLTGATMHWDCRATAARVSQPCLVVTSRDDHTAHPAGSRRLAEILIDSTLVMTEHGTHLDAFRATDEQVRCLTSFLAVRHPGEHLPASHDNRPAEGWRGQVPARSN